jgi:hypothetical protein
VSKRSRTSVSRYVSKALAIVLTHLRVKRHFRSPFGFGQNYWQVRF